MQNIAVIGAGPAGMTAAYVLSRRGVPVDLYEASPHVGGMARSMEMWGQTVDIGPHRYFSSDPRVNRLWLEVVGEDYAMVGRLTRIFFRNRFYYYPIKAGNALRNLGGVEAVSCVLSYLAQRARRPGRELGESFESWVTARFGRRLYEHFFKTYTEKLWGISGRELGSEFAAQRIKSLSLGAAVKDAFVGHGGRRHRTLVDEFAYPLNGSGQVYERMRQSVEEHGGRVFLRTPIDSLVTAGGAVTGVRLTSGEKRDYDHVISSMPLTLLVERLPDVPPDVAAANRSLQFRNTLLVYLQIDSENVFPDNWIYVHSGELRMGRITNFRNWVPSLNRGKPETILAIEYWCFDEDDFWHWTSDRHIDLARRELVGTGLVRPEMIKDGAVVRVPRCYPVYRRGYQRQLVEVERFLRKFTNLQVIGRYGAFKYNNQDHSILMGMLAADNVCGIGEQQDLWAMNSDYEYQESSEITRTGLVTHGAA